MNENQTNPNSEKKELTTAPLKSGIPKPIGEARNFAPCEAGTPTPPPSSHVSLEPPAPAKEKAEATPPKAEPPLPPYLYGTQPPTEAGAQNQPLGAPPYGQPYYNAPPQQQAPYMPPPTYGQPYYPQNPQQGYYGSYQGQGTQGAGAPYSGYEQNGSSAYQWDYNQLKEADPKKGTKTKSKGARVFVIALSGALVLGIAAIVGVGMNSAKLDPQSITGDGYSIPEEPGVPNGAISGADDPVIGDSSLGNTEDLIKQPTGEILSPPDVAEKVTPSVVGILRYEDTLYQATGLGSGFILSEENGVAYIVTNAHVVESGTNFKVRLYDERELDAQLVGADSETDLAVLRIKVTDVTPAEMGDSTLIRVGEPVLAIGNPISLDLSGSVTGGLISAVNRNLHTGNTVNYIQTDAAINPGNSGGALANQYGQVIGINTMKVQGEGLEGIGFAIPISEALPIVEELVAYGRVASRPALGIQGKEITEMSAYQLNCPVGIMVMTVEDSAKFTPAIKAEDIITHADGTRILGLSDLKEVLNAKEIGDTATLTIYRRINTVDTDEFDTTVVLIAAS